MSEVGMNGIEKVRRSMLSESLLDCITRLLLPVISHETLDWTGRDAESF